jgi:hypothetical protein
LFRCSPESVDAEKVMYDVVYMLSEKLSSGNEDLEWLTVEASFIEKSVISGMV